jgi:nucleotide-binding universal stress UspA family protein
MKNVLVAVDFSDLTEDMMKTTEEMVSGTRAIVWLLHCINQYTSISAMMEVPMGEPVLPADLPDRYPQEYRHLGDLALRLRSSGIRTEVLLVSGNVTDEILSAVDRHQVDLIIIGSHGHGLLYNLIVGSVTKSVLYYADKPALIVPAPGRRVREPLSPQIEEEQSMEAIGPTI